MEYKLKIGEETTALEVTPRERGRFDVATPDGVCAVEATAVTPNHLLVRAAGRPAANLYVAEAPEGLWVWVAGRAVLVEDADQTQRRVAKRGGQGGAKEVTPPTPATVVAVTAEVGQVVAKGDGLVVVSAMKMEFNLTAPYAGTVTAVNTQVGAKANPGEILVEIAPAEEEATHG